MIPPHPSASTQESLRSLTAPIALDYCARLLDRSKDGTLTFDDFVAAARSLLLYDPEISAIYLAALVALDMQHIDEDAVGRSPHAPSSN